MRVCIIIPVYNEIEHLNHVLDSYTKQSAYVNKLVLVDDNSNDGSYEMCSTYASSHDWIEVYRNRSKGKRIPGQKVIANFKHGLSQVDIDSYDLIGKFDADIILPQDYFFRMINIFEANPKVGIAGGNIYVKKDKSWIYENIAERTKVRGPIKLYRRDCFKEIGGLKESIGWDTVDELLILYFGWEIRTESDLMVKHLRKTGHGYSSLNAQKQGEAFRRMRYGMIISIIAAMKQAIRLRSIAFFFNCMRGYIGNGRTYIVDQEQGKFIRKFRWKKIRKKLF